MVVYNSIGKGCKSMKIPGRIKSKKMRKNKDCISKYAPPLLISIPASTPQRIKKL